MINAVIIDDEEDAREELRRAIERYCPEVALKCICSSPEEGIEVINTIRPDLIFLDVQMPRLSGFDVLQRVSEVSFEVILVSAYDKYAIKAIRFSALDYLLKPIDVDELVQAVGKITGKGHNATTQHHYQSVLHNFRHSSGHISRLAIPFSEGIDFLETEEIIYCKAEGSYTTVYLTLGRKKLVSKSLKEFEVILSDSGFCRVHHSFLVNLQHVQKYVKGEGGNVILTDGHNVDVSKRKKEEFINKLDKV